MPYFDHKKFSHFSNIKEKKNYITQKLHYFKIVNNSAQNTLYYTHFLCLVLFNYFSEKFLREIRNSIKIFQKTIELDKA